MIIGYRFFVVRNLEQPLGSVSNVSYPYWNLSKKTTALCNLQYHFAPEEKCSCGLYAFKDLSYCVSNAGEFIRKVQFRYDGSSYPIVMSQIILWGKIIEHEFGCRAEFGKVSDILAIFANNNSVFPANVITSIFGIPKLIPEIIKFDLTCVRLCMTCQEQYDIIQAMINPYFAKVGISVASVIPDFGYLSSENIPELKKVPIGSKVYFEISKQENIKIGDEICLADFAPTLSAVCDVNLEFAMIEMIKFRRLGEKLWEKTL